LESWSNLKANILYLKMLFDFFVNGMYLRDLSRINVVYDGEKIFLIDLDASVTTRFNFIYECMRLILKPKIDLKERIFDI
jgi:hypothetical protein